VRGWWEAGDELIIDLSILDLTILTLMMTWPRGKDMLRKQGYQIVSFKPPDLYHVSPDSSELQCKPWKLSKAI